MCGIAGFLTWERNRHETTNSLAQHVSAMADTMVARGPNDHGTWVDPAVAIALGFLRLAILDLSLAGHQPMVSASGRYVIVFNGEIYNHRELRKRLGSDAADLPDKQKPQSSERPSFRGTSD